VVARLLSRWFMDLLLSLVQTEAILCSPMRRIIHFETKLMLDQQSALLATRLHSPRVLGVLVHSWSDQWYYLQRCHSNNRSARSSSMVDPGAITTPSIRTSALLYSDFTALPKNYPLILSSEAAFYSAHPFLHSLRRKNRSISMLINHALL